MTHKKIENSVPCESGLVYRIGYRVLLSKKISFQAFNGLTQYSKTDEF